MPRDPAVPPPVAAWALAAALALGLCGRAAAEEERRAPAPPMLPSYKTECAACHVAYPPGMLPAASWQHLMTRLPNHFGTDASLDPEVVRSLSTWLSANAATGRRAQEAPPEDRITRSAWFVRQHDEVPAAVWKRPSIKSASNCAACHTGADQGDFNEHRVRIPR
ncbi:diheme cytochrome c [Ideonella azotifigens]|uniref:Diheme cytochrome c n=1 Tax=Ideonella azotifigens TaxID=513160 RepID=A0ABN1K317_9BURK|nr:diheme cytochrome c [Ideonella azotifigens]